MPRKAAKEFIGEDGKPIERSKFIRQLAKQASTQFNATVRGTDVEQLLKNFEKDKPLEDDAPEEYKKTLGLIEAAYKANDDAVKAAEEAQKKAEKEAEAKKSKELAIVDKAISLGGEGLANLAQKFDLGNGLNQCVPRGEVTTSELTAMLVFQLGMNNCSNWATGDLVVELEKRGMENIVSFVCEKTGKAYSSVSGIARVCRAVPPDKRDPEVAFTNYREFYNASFSDNAEVNLKTQNRLFEKFAKAQKKGEPVKARDLIAEEKGTPPGDTPPHERENALFIVVPTKGEIVRVRGFKAAKKHADGGSILFGNQIYTGSGKNKWAAIEELKETEEAAKE